MSRGGMTKRRFAKQAAAKEETNPFDQLEKDGKKHNPPIQIFGTPARFATAAYRQASQKGELEKVENDLKTISGILEGEDELRGFVNDPTVLDKDKREALSIIGSEYKFSEVTTSLLDVMVESGKLSQVDKINDVFTKYMAASRGEVISVVTSAEPLSKKDEGAIKKALEGRLQKGQKLIMETKVDPKIIGGLVVEFGDELADLSVSTSLEDIGEALNSPGDE